MGDGSDESDAFVPEPAVVLWVYISGRRHVRVPEVAHRCVGTLRRNRISTYCYVQAHVNAIQQPFTFVAALKAGAAPVCAWFPHQIILDSAVRHDCVFFIFYKWVRMF